jgi:WD40 repeat protein
MSKHILAPVVSFLAFLTLAGQARADQPAKVDVHGDPLPAGAIARLGTVRWRHGERTRFVAFLPDGKALLSAGDDGTVRQWDLATGKELRRFGLPREFQGTFAMSADGKVLASRTGTLGKSVQLWDVATGKKLMDVESADGTTHMALTSAGKTLAVYGRDGTIRLYDVATGKELAKLGENSEKDSKVMGASLVFSPNEKKLAAVKWTPRDKADLAVWDLDTGIASFRVAGKGRMDLRGVAFSPDGRLLAWVNHEDKIVLADATTGAEARRLGPGRMSTMKFHSIGFAPDAKTILGNAAFGRFAVWDTATGQQLRTFEMADLRSGDSWWGDWGRLAISADGKLLALAGAPGAIPIIDIARGTEVIGDGGHRQTVKRVSFGRDGKQVFTVDASHDILAWETATGKLLRTVSTRRPGSVNYGSNATVLSDDGRLLASLDPTPGSVRLRDLGTGKEIRTAAREFASWPTLAISANGKLLAVVGTDDKKRFIWVYDATTGKEIRVLTLPSSKRDPNIAGPNDSSVSLSLLQFAPDGRTLAAPLGNSNNILLWDVTTGRELPTIKWAETQSISAIAFSADGRSLAAEFGGGIPRLWETVTGQERRRCDKKAVVANETLNAAEWAAEQWGYFGPYGEVVALSPDGRLLAEGRPGGTVRVWSVVGGNEVGRLVGHQAEVTTLAFASDGKTLASGSRDTSVLIWDLSAFAAKANPQAAPVDAAARWQDLMSDDASRAFDAICALAAAPDKAVPYLKAHARAAVATDAATIRRLIAELDSDRFDVRQKASGELAELGEAAVPFVRKALEANPSLEARKRLEALLAKEPWRVPTGETLRSLRAIEVLEMIGTAEAKSVLKDLANGTAEAWVTREARAALNRLER